MLAEREVGLDPILNRRDARLLEPADLRLGKLLICEVGKRLAAPEGQRVSKRRRGALEVALIEGPAPLAGELLEAIGVDLPRPDLERVAAATGDEDLGVEQLAQA